MTDKMRATIETARRHGVEDVYALGTELERVERDLAREKAERLYLEDELTRVRLLLTSVRRSSDLACA